MHEAVNGTELRLVGMSRSGNHALIHWIISQLNGSYCFLNCCEGKSNPFETARVLDDGRRCWTNITGFDLDREIRGQLTAKDWLLFSHEDAFLGHACSEIFEREHDAWVGPSRRRLDVLLLRDPFNLFASRMSLPSIRISPATAARIWKQHARQLIAGPGALRHSPLLVRYDRWVSEPGYRRELGEAIGLRFTDEGISEVPACAGGSSFDGRVLDGAASRMRVFDRWRRVVSDPIYRQYFDDQLIEMATEIFGPHPAVDVLRASP